MKKKIILHLNILFFYAMVFSAKAQTGRIIYQVFSSHQMENLSEDIYQYFDLVNISIENNPMDFELTFNRGEAFFEIKDRIGTNDFQTKISKVMLGGMKKFYSNIETEEFLKQEVAYGETFLIPFNKPDWELSNSSKMIGKYKCYKATTFYIVVMMPGVLKKT